MKRPFAASLVLALSSSLFGGTAPKPPQLGLIRQQDKSLRTLLGVPGNLINGNRVLADPVDSASFSNDAGLVFTAGVIKLLEPDGAELGTWPTAERKPLLNVSGAAATAVAWLRSEHAFVRWEADHFSLMSADCLPPGETPLQLRFNGTNELDMLLSAGDGVVDQLACFINTGQTVRLRTIYGVHGPATQVGNTLVFEDRDGIVIDQANKPPIAFPFRESDLTFEAASEHWIHISSNSTGHQWMLHVNGESSSLSELPRVAAPQVSGINGVPE